MTRSVSADPRVGTELAGYRIIREVVATSARVSIVETMPDIVLVSRSIPSAEYAILREVAGAVGAEILITPDDTSAELVELEVEIAIERTRKRRGRS